MVSHRRLSDVEPSESRRVFRIQTANTNVRLSLSQPEGHNLGLMATRSTSTGNDPSGISDEYSNGTLYRVPVTTIGYYLVDTRDT